MGYRTHPSRWPLVLATAAILIGGTGAPVKAQDKIAVSMAPGASGTTINGTVIGEEYIDYVLNVSAGQTMYATLNVTGTNGNGSAFFNILPGGKDYDGLYTGSTDVNRSAEVTFPTSGEWVIRVYLMGNDRDSGKTVGYSIDVLIPPAKASTGASINGASTAGSFMATVTGVGGGDLLNVRSGPGTDKPIIGKMANGDRVRNLGCVAHGSSEWCQIEMMTDMHERGWVNSRYLTRGAAAQLPEKPTSVGAGGSATVRVRFSAGSSGAELTGVLAPGDSRRYVLGAGNGQDLYVRLAARGPDMYYQIFNPDGTFLLDQMRSAQEYRGQLWQAGDHVIEVINRSNQTQSYNVIFGIN